MPPRPAEVVVACLAVLAGCVAAAAGLTSPRRGGRWLNLIWGTGAVLAVAGIAGQRVPGEGRPGPWDAGVGLPVVGLRLTPVTLCGILMILLGISAVLFLEPGRRGGSPPAPAATPDFDEDDTA